MQVTRADNLVVTKVSVVLRFWRTTGPATSFFSHKAVISPVTGTRCPPRCAAEVAAFVGALTPSSVGVLRNKGVADKATDEVKQHLRWLKKSKMFYREELYCGHACGTCWRRHFGAALLADS